MRVLAMRVAELSAARRAGRRFRRFPTGTQSSDGRQKNKSAKMDQATLQVVRAVEAGATTIKEKMDATGLSRLKIERALNALEKQRLLELENKGFRAAVR